LIFQGKPLFPVNIRKKRKRIPVSFVINYPESIIVSKKKRYESHTKLDTGKGNVSDKPGLINFPHHLGSAVIKPEDKGRTRGRAMSAMKQQMKVLVSQANQIKERFKISEWIYQSRINFEPVIGHTYFLYLTKENEYVLSMIAPKEWGEDFPYKSYQASVKLLSDHTWEVLESIPQDHTRE
jgi:hypothetical protein